MAVNRSNLGIAIAGLASGLILGAGAVSISQGTHENITINQGDTVIQRFSIANDSILSVIGDRVVLASKCGNSRIQFRNYLGHSDTLLSVDSVFVKVQNCYEKVTRICITPNRDSLNKYIPNWNDTTFKQDTTVDPKLIPCMNKDTIYASSGKLKPVLYMWRVRTDTLKE